MCFLPFMNIPTFARCSDRYVYVPSFEEGPLWYCTVTKVTRTYVVHLFYFFFAIVALLVLYGLIAFLTEQFQCATCSGIIMDSANDTTWAYAIFYKN